MPPVSTALFGLASTQLGVSPSLVNLIFLASASILIGAPMYLIAKNKGNGSSSFANY